MIGWGYTFACGRKIFFLFHSITICCKYNVLFCCKVLQCTLFTILFHCKRYTAGGNVAIWALCKCFMMNCTLNYIEIYIFVQMYHVIYRNCNYNVHLYCVHKNMVKFIKTCGCIMGKTLGNREISLTHNLFLSWMWLHVNLVESESDQSQKNNFQWFLNIRGINNPLIKGWIPDI